MMVTPRVPSALSLVPIVLGSILLGIIIGGFLPRSHQSQNPDRNSNAASSPTTAGVSEEHSSSAKQTDNADDEAANWPPGFRPSSWANWALAILAIWAGNIALNSLDTLNVQTAEVKKGNEISRDALIADQRPWLSMQVQLIGPFSRDMDPRMTRHDWHATVHVALHNHGKTPAIDVQVTPKLIPQTTGYFTGGADDNGPKGQFVEGTNVRQEVEIACRTTEKAIRTQMKKAGISFGFGEVIYPGEDGSATIRVPFPGEELPVPENYFGHFILVVGVSYDSTFEGTEDFKTGRAFRVWKNGGDGHIKFSGEGLPVEAIGFMPEPWGTGNLTT
jgi:hypothetical protein